MKLLTVCLMSVLMSFPTAYGTSRATELKHVRSHHTQYGLASWYGERNQGHLMACGEPFNEDLMIAAHRTLPLGTRVRVTNLRNGRTVVVRILDRGPAVAGRVIDLSKAAARRLQFTRRGLTPVKIRVLTTPNAKGQSAALDGGRERTGPRA
jgi:rare lipoprotein A